MSTSTFETNEITRRKQRIGETLCCPYCEKPLSRWEVPQTPFTEWDAEHVWVCFNPECPYTRRSIQVMESQGNRGVAYRLMYLPERDRIYPVPDLSLTVGS
jgi:uncharacterized protein YbaR (Trm112 family)